MLVVYSTSLPLSNRLSFSVGVHRGSALSLLLSILCTDTVTAGNDPLHPWPFSHVGSVDLEV